MCGCMKVTCAGDRNTGKILKGGGGLVGGGGHFKFQILYGFFQKIVPH